MKHRYIIVALALCSLVGCSPARLNVSAKLEPAKLPGAAVSVPVLVMPLIDERPQALRQSHEPTTSRYWGLSAVYFAFGTGRTDGALFAGDENTSIRSDEKSGSSLAVFESWLADLLIEVTGSQLEASRRRLKLSELSSAASQLAGGEGYVIIPVLDQLDTMLMRSAGSISGGSSSQSGNTRTTTSGSSSSSARTMTYSNLRLRLVLLEVRGAQIVRQGIAYIATSDASRRPLQNCIDKAAEPIARRSLAFIQDSASSSSR